METIIVTAFIILAGGIALTVLERRLFVGKRKGAQMLLILAAVLLVAHGIGLLGIPPHVMGRMVWDDFAIAATLLAASFFITRRVAVARLLGLVGGVAMCVVHGCWFVAECGQSLSSMLQDPSFALLAEFAVIMIGIVTALTSFHLRWLDVDPYHPF